ncbi:MAG: flagellar motor switch protein FliG [Clostridium sp.]|nr:flagellar motor switch protein FliG [Clostridium sp.]MCM1547573.1 flagellar motor switch protein FliG [Ruminococcus sp.]
MANTSTKQQSASGTKKISPATKVAAVIIALGADSASEVYKYLRDDEIEEISSEISKIDTLSSEEMKEIVEDFYDLCITQNTIAEGGEEYAREVLEKAFGAQRSAFLMEQITKSGKVRAFEKVRKVDYKNLQMLLQNEHPQTIAIVLSYARADQASAIISELPREIQLDVIKRISNLDRASPEIISIVEGIMNKKLSSVSSVAVTEMGGVSYIAEIMNRVDRKTEKYIFDELSEEDPVLADDIKKLMFVFDDIIYLDNMEIQTFIREIDTKDLTVALKAASEEVTNVILNNMSQRQRETITTDMQYLHNVRMRDVEEAQQKIVAVIRQLEESGDIVISKGGEDEIIA